MKNKLRFLVSFLALLAALFLTPTSAKAFLGGGSKKPAAAPANPTGTTTVNVPSGTPVTVAVNEPRQPAAQPATTPPTPSATPATAGTPAGAPAKVVVDTTKTKPVTTTKTRGGGNGASARSQSHLEPIVLDWTDKFQCVPLGIGYPLSVKPDIALNPGMQPKEALCLGKKAEIIARLNLNENHLNDEGVVVDRARDVEGVLSLSASANGFAQTFIDQESKKVGRPLSQQEVQDRLDCMRAAKAWGITQGKVQYARTGTSAHTMGASRDKRFTQDGRAADGAVGAWCLDKDEVLSLEDARALARRDGGAKDIKELKKRVGRMSGRIDEIWLKIQEMDGKIAGHDAVLVNHEGRIQELERRKNWFAVGATVEMTARRPGNVPFGVQLGWMGERFGGKLFFAAQLNLLFMKEQYQLDRVKLPTSALGVGGIVTVAKKWNNGFVFGGSAAGLISQSVSFQDGRTASHGTVSAFLGAGPAIGVVGRRFYGLLSVPIGWEWNMVPVVKDGRTLLPVAGGFGVLPNMGIGAKF